MHIIGESRLSDFTHTNSESLNNTHAGWWSTGVCVSVCDIHSWLFLVHWSTTHTNPHELLNIPQPIIIIWGSRCDAVLADESHSRSSRRHSRTAHPAHHLCHHRIYMLTIACFRPLRFRSIVSSAHMLLMAVRARCVLRTL